MKLAVRHILELHDPAEPARDGEGLVLPVADAQAVMGETVAAFLARVDWRFDLPTVCRIDGRYYGRDEWATQTLAANDNVEFISRPLGSGSSGSAVKSIAAVVALVALTAVAGPAGAAAAGTFAAAGSATFAVASAVISAAIVGAGSLAISYFLSPKSGGKSKASEELYSFGFQGNAARPMQPIPVLNGRVRFAPDYAAPTYSEYDGATMTDYALFALTCGRMRVEQLLIGDTPIWDYQTGYSPDYPGISIQIVEPGDQVTLYPVNVVTADELSGAELTVENTPGYIVNAAGTLASQLLVDFVWPGGIYRTNSEGKTIPGATHIIVRVRPVNDAGAPIGDWSDVFGKIYTFAKQTQIRVTERIAVAPGRYEVSARRVNAPISESGKGSDAVTWTALRAHIDGPQSFPRVMTLAVKGVASQKLSGISGGQLRVIGTRILPVWRNGQFVEEPTRSIAWAALDWWRNGDYAAGLSLTDTDFQAFLAYDALWTSLGHTFDYRFSEVQNLDEVLETVLKAGRAFPAPVGDKLTITRDQPRGLSRMLFTENDIVRDSLEIDYVLSDTAWADGIVGEYVDQTTWRLAEVSSAPDGVVLLKPARVQLQGVVDRKQATGMVRFMAAESQYRRITVSWAARSEGRLLKRGDLVKVSAEEPETWGQSCEILTVASDGRTLTLDPPPLWEATGNHYVEIRRRDGRPWGPAKVTRGPSDAVAIVNEADAASVASSQGMSLADAVARSDSQERPWLAFSPGQPRTFPVLITEGDPDQDGEHIHLSGVLDAAEVYTTTEDGVPALPQIPDLFSSTLPTIIGLGAVINQRQLTLVLSASWQPARNAASYVADVSYDDGESWVRAYEGDRAEFEAIVGGSDQMRVRVAGITPAGLRGVFYVVAVEAPSITVNGSIFEDLSVEIAKLSAQAQMEVASINAIGQQALAEGLETIAQGRGTVREEMRRLQAFLDDLANAAATQAGQSFEARQTLKVGTTASFAAIERVDTLRISDKEAIAVTTTSLGARLTTAEGGIVGNAGAIQTLQTSVTNIDGRVTSQATSITSLGSRIDGNDLTLSGQATAISGLTTRVSVTEGGITSLSSRYDTLSATVTQQGSDASGTATAVSNLSTRVSANEGGISSLSSKYDTLNSTVTQQGSDAAATATAVQGLKTDVSSINGTLSSQASSIQTLSTTQDGHTATLTTYGTSIDGVKVQFGVTGYIGGGGDQAGGFVFTGVRKLDGSVSYNLLVLGDFIATGTITGRTLAAENLITVSAQIGTLIVDNVSIKNGAISQTVSNYSTGTSASVSVNVRSGARVLVQAYFDGASQSQFPIGTGVGVLSVRRDGTAVKDVSSSFAVSGNNDNRTIAFLAQTNFFLDAPAAGVHTYGVVTTNGGGAGGVGIVVTELSK